jgi:hypothetical protein
MVWSLVLSERAPMALMGVVAALTLPCLPSLTAKQAAPRGRKVYEDEDGISSEVEDARFSHVVTRISFFLSLAAAIGLSAVLFGAFENASHATIAVWVRHEFPRQRKEVR